MVEEDEDLVWQEDTEEEARENDFHQTVNVVEFAENHFDQLDQHDQEEITM